MTDPNVQQAVERDIEYLRQWVTPGNPDQVMKRVSRVLSALAAVTKGRDALKESILSVEGPGIGWHEVMPEFLYEGKLVAEKLAKARIELAKLREALDSIERGRMHEDTADLLAEAVSVAKSALSAPAPKLKKVWVVRGIEEGVAYADYDEALNVASKLACNPVPAYMEVQE